MRKFIQILVLSAMTMSAHAADKINDTLIIPGVRIGVITKDTNEEELQRLLPGQVKRTLAIYVDRYVCATQLFPNSDKELVIIWENPTAYPAANEYESEQSQKICDTQPAMTKILEIHIRGSAWRTAEGAYLGMTLAELEKANGAPVGFTTSETEAHGGIIDWHAGKYSDQAFKHLWVSPVRMTLDYHYDENAQKIWSESEENQLINQSMIDSNNIPDDKKQKITLGVFELTFPNECDDGNCNKY